MDLDNKCIICDVDLTHTANKISHLTGKKHKILERKKRTEVYVTDLPPNLDRLHMQKFFSNLGNMVSCKFDIINRFVLFQYSKPAQVQRILSNGVIYLGHRLTVKSTIGLKENLEFNENDHYTKIVHMITAANERTFSEQMTLFLSHILPNPEIQIKNYEMICNDLKRIIDNVYPGCIIHPYGSSTTNLNFLFSDFDVYVEVDSKYKKEIPEIDLLKAVRQIFYTSKNKSFTNVIAITQARTPIIKSVHILTNINCDFQFKNRIGICNSKLINYYLSLSKNLKPTFLILKYWAKVKDFIGLHKHFTSYALTMMFIFCIQNSELGFPTVHNLQENKNFADYEDGWNCGFECKRFSNPDLQEMSPVQLLKVFYLFYKNFDFNSQIICPYLGKAICKSEFINNENVREEFEIYRKQISLNTTPLVYNKPICIQDPFEHNRNITLNATLGILQKFIEACLLALNLLTDEQSSLYNLFMLNKAPPSDTSRIVRFNVGMGNCSTYLEQQLKIKDVIEEDTNIRKIWVHMFENFLYRVLEDVLLLEIQEVGAVPWNKFSNCTEKMDSTYDSEFDVLKIHCAGEKDVLFNRKKISLKLKIPNNVTTILEKEEFLSNHNVNTKSKSFFDIIIYLKARKTPTEIEVQIQKHDRFKGCFASFGSFLSKHIPKWFGNYQIELNNAAKKQTAFNKI